MMFPLWKFWTYSPRGFLAAIVWNISELLGVRCPYGPTLLGWIIGADKARTMVCDCCSRPFLDGNGGVVSSSLGAISFAYCRECLSNGAEPEIMFIHLRDNVARPDGSGLREEVYDMVTWKDGKYITFRDWLKDNPYKEQENEGT